MHLSSGSWWRWTLVDFSQENAMNQPSLQHAHSRFRPGRIFATAVALEALTDANVPFISLLVRHAQGDWGDLSESDHLQNELAVETGQRILSSYVLPNRQTA